jgi:hypothetical protein
VNQGGGQHCRVTRRMLAKPRLHFIECLNAVFTLLNNSKFRPFLRVRINCVEIVAPVGFRMVTVLRTPARPNISSTSLVYTGVIDEEPRFALREG